MQQQQHADFDLLAIFPEESTADAAEAKLRKEGFGDEEVFRLAPGSVGRGEFREHRATQDRSALFLQTKRSGPSPLLVVLLALIFGLVLGGLTFGIVDFAIRSIQVLPATLLGVLVGLILGAILGLTRRGRVRGAIGQDLNRVKPPETPARKAQESADLRTAIGVRLPDAENIGRKSKARAILLNNGGKIDRSVGS
ncbi:MAG TPA: hypothetical protein VGD98_25255 [Ktedonobacteraceae bacterium]